MLISNVITGKEYFAEAFKNLARHRSENNFVEIKIFMLKIQACCEMFLHSCLTSLSILHNYFNNPIKLFSHLYLVKFLDT